MFTKIKHRLIFILLLLGLAFSVNFFKVQVRNNQIEKPRPPLYLPDVEYVRLLTLGFNNFASDILWFNTINYFGQQYIAGKDFKWLSHMCNLVTKLDEKSEAQFEFCGNLLSWMAKEPVASNELLTRAIKAHPHSWRFPYMRGFNYWYFLEDNEKAREDMILATKRPNAPEFLTSLASRLISKTQDPRVAIEFLQRSLNRTSDENVKNAIEEKLKRAYLNLHSELLMKAINKYQEETGKVAQSLNDLVETGFLRFIPEDPFGGTYYLKNGEIRNTSNEKGLEFFGKTAKTGMFADEFKDKINFKD